MRLARATVAGSGELLHQSDVPARLAPERHQPGGTTAAALAVLMAPDGLEALMAGGCSGKAARHRTRELKQFPEEGQAFRVKLCAETMAWRNLRTRLEIEAVG